jgi:queuine tRNA-ribosyltransferase
VTAIPAGTSVAPTCTTLKSCNEILGSQLNTLHNLHYYQRHMRDIRAAIEAGELEQFAAQFYARTAAN